MTIINLLNIMPLCFSIWKMGKQCQPFILQKLLSILKEIIAIKVSS